MGKKLPFIEMHIVKLNITGNQVGSEEFFEFAGYYFHSLYRSKQIINEEWQYEPIDGGLGLNLFCPEEDSWSENNSTIYAKKWKRKLEEELKCKFDFKHLGLDTEIGKTTIPQKINFFILKTARVSPLIEGDSMNQIQY
jgi:hypothetical protein